LKVENDRPLRLGAHILEFGRNKTTPTIDQLRQKHGAFLATRGRASSPAAKTANGLGLIIHFLTAKDAKDAKGRLGLSAWVATSFLTTNFYE
jgi:hypothetical protein